MISDQVLVPVLNFVTLAILTLAGAWLRKKLQISNHEQANLIWDDVEDIVETAVLSLNQTVVDNLKKNGGWSAEKAIEIKTQAFTNIILQAGPKIGILIEKNRDYVMDLIERKVAENKLHE